jgi:hypothetical protein
MSLSANVSRSLKTGRTLPLPGLVLAVILTVFFCITQLPLLAPPPGQHTTYSGDTIHGCSVFTLAKGGQVFFGGNDDYINPDSYYWADNSREGSYGTIWIGTPDNVQQGVNEAGLAYDANGLPRFDTNPHNERTPVSGGYTSYPVQIMRECATVAEVIEWVQTRQWHTFMHDQMQFADAGGDAVIISAGIDGELVLTRKEPGDGFLVSTNFNVANPSNGYSYPCWRYDTASGILAELSTQDGNLTVADAAGVLEAVHVSGGASWTIESLVADLQNKKIYLYYFHQFDDPVVIDVAEELANPHEAGPLSRLFPEEVREEAKRRYEVIQSEAARCRLLGIFWFTLTAISLILFLLISKCRSRGMLFWILIIIVLGPLGLLIRLLAADRGSSTTRHLILIETAGDTAPPAAALITALVVMLSIPKILSSGLLQVVLVFGLPLVIGLLLFNGPLLKSAAGGGFSQIILKRYPHVIVVSLLAMGGMSIVIMPLVNLALSSCLNIPLPLSMAGIIWAIVALGTVPGGLLVWTYNWWQFRKGFRAWGCLVSDEIEFRTPDWRNLIWWIVLSIAALIIGMMAGMLINSFMQNL